jgi:glyoxylase-like metal-dependent hydrolase (beta-lactamase superfamily II)
MKVAYTQGLHELGDGVFAYLQPNGGWGWSNAGLISSAGTSMLVDTLFDLTLTRRMLDAMRPVTDRSPIQQAMNTHANGDHCFGNQLLPEGIDLYASAAAAAEMKAVPPALVHGLFNELELGPAFDEFAQRTMRRFDFKDIEQRLPSRTFDGKLDLKVGDRSVRLLELGPAHTSGDAIVHVPDASTVFTGDLLFIEGTPIMWEGPVDNWLRACDRILELGADVLVPGHGPVTDASGVRDVQRYLTHVRDEARQRFDAGMSAEDAADDIDISDFNAWGDPERIAVNVETLYEEFDSTRPPVPVPQLFVRMAEWSRRHR